MRIVFGAIDNNGTELDGVVFFPEVLSDCVCFIFSFFNSSFLLLSSEVGFSTGFPIPTILLGLLVGCLRVIEPILSPHLDKLKHTWVGFNLAQI